MNSIFELYDEVLDAVPQKNYGCDVELVAQILVGYGGIEGSYANLLNDWCT